MNEDDLKAKCRVWIKKYPPDQFWFYCPTDHFYAGIPDMIFVFGGKFGWVEFKTPKGKVTEIQKWTHKAIMDSGGRGAVIRSFEEFKNFITVFHNNKEESDGRSEEPRHAGA